MNGVIIIDKPKGFTSHDIVNILRKETSIKKIGHTGTLDPNATGVLPILIGNATKISKYLIEHNKTYIVEMKLGEETDTLDSEGSCIKKQEVQKLNEDKIVKVLRSFLGKQQQIPPIYSSIKINGKKAYEYARRGQAVEIKPREIEIYEINFLEYFDDVIKFQVKCSKGTYIRTLCKDIAQKLGTIAYMKELKRTKVDIFKIEKAITITNIKNKTVDIKKSLISIEEIFESNEKIYLNNRKMELFLNGVQLTYNVNDGLYTIYLAKKFIGLGTVKNNLLKRDVIV